MEGKLPKAKGITKTQGKEKEKETKTEQDTSGEWEAETKQKENNKELCSTRSMLAPLRSSRLSSGTKKNFCFLPFSVCVFGRDPMRCGLCRCPIKALLDHHSVVLGIQFENTWHPLLQYLANSDESIMAPLEAIVQLHIRLEKATQMQAYRDGLEQGLSELAGMNPADAKQHAIDHMAGRRSRSDPAEESRQPPGETTPTMSLSPTIRQ